MTINDLIKEVKNLRESAMTEVDMNRYGLVSAGKESAYSVVLRLFEDLDSIKEPPKDEIITTDMAHAVMQAVRVCPHLAASKTDEELYTKVANKATEILKNGELEYK